MYEKPVATILRMEDSMQIICSSGFTSKTGIEIEHWGTTTETNAEGTSDTLKALPDWLKP